MIRSACPLVLQFKLGALHIKHVTVVTADHQALLQYRVPTVITETCHSFSQVTAAPYEAKQACPAQQD